MASSDGKRRDLVSTIPGAGWDFGISRHPYHEIERPYGPHYTVYNRRLMACHFDKINTEEGYWLLRQKAAVLHTGELPLQFEGPDAEQLVNLLFTKDFTKLKPGRCGYGLACYEDGGMITDGVVLRLSDERFWYAQADGDLYSWARAHAAGLAVSITDPEVYVSQVQGPNSMKVLQAASDDGLPEPFGYFGIARVSLGGQQVVISRTGYTNELGWEFYTEPHHDPVALWHHLESKGTPHGMNLHGLDSMHIRRVEAGILNAGSDFNRFTTPFDVGLGRFVDMKKPHFLGKQALEEAPRETRLWGIACPSAEPHIGAGVQVSGRPAGTVTAGAFSPFLKHGIGFVLMDGTGFHTGEAVSVGCIDGEQYDGTLVTLPFYDPQGEIPRGKRVDIPQRG
tara:strand:- start:115 stop:1299 length:1185 start_codon:yes stop_codon:yes gene_type:complete